MSILIGLAAIVSFLSFAIVQGRGVAFLLAVTVTFTLWVGLMVSIGHPLVDWRDHFVSGSLAVAGAVAFLVGASFEIVRRLRRG